MKFDSSERVCVCVCLVVVAMVTAELPAAYTSACISMCVLSSRLFTQQLVISERKCLIKQRIQPKQQDSHERTATTVFQSITAPVFSRFQPLLKPISVSEGCALCLMSVNIWKGLKRPLCCCSLTRVLPFAVCSITGCSCSPEDWWASESPATPPSLPPS